jgi:hypothetical protein
VKWPAPLFCIALSCAAAPSLPRGDVVAVLVQGEGVRVLAPDGERLVPGTAEADTFAWDGDGEALLVTHGGRLERIALDGTRTTLLDGGRELRFPDASVTGARADGAIVVASRAAGADDSGWRIVLVGGDAARVEDLGPGYDPCFTADGSGVLLETLGDDGPSIVHLDLARGVRRRLATGHTPASARRGSLVLFSRGGHLWSVDLAADPVVERQLTEDGDYNRFASMSPDGTRIVFFRQDDGRDSIVERELATGTERTLAEGRVTLPAYRP